MAVDEIIARLLKLLTRLGYLVEERGMTYLADIDPHNPLMPLQAAACTYRIALGPRAGHTDSAGQTPFVHLSRGDTKGFVIDVYNANRLDTIAFN